VYILFRHHVLSEQLLLKTAELQKADGAVRALSEQVDATSSAATLMENMTQANMALEDKARALTEEIADLNTVIEMNEQVWGGLCCLFPPRDSLALNTCLDFAGGRDPQRHRV
jgi:hypothetical protein